MSDREKPPPFVAICPTCFTTRESGDVKADKQWAHDHYIWHTQEPR